MLFTDSPAVAIEDLAAYETGLLDTAATEGIDLTVKIQLAINEVGLDLQQEFTQQSQQTAFTQFGLSNVTINNVVVTPALKQWILFHTLELVYRDAYFNQLNDRYKAKWDQNTELATEAAAQYFQIGIGLVSDPIPQAANPALSLTTGSLAPGKYFVEVAWRNSAGQEGSPSETTALAVPSGETLQVAAVNPPPNAVSWNVYIGSAPESLFLQNSTPLAPSATWVQPNSLIITGTQPGTGQPPAFLSPAPNIL